MIVPPASSCSPPPTYLSVPAAIRLSCKSYGMVPNYHIRPAAGRRQPTTDEGNGLIKQTQGEISGAPGESASDMVLLVCYGGLGLLWRGKQRVSYLVSCAFGCSLWLIPQFERHISYYSQK